MRIGLWISVLCGLSVPLGLATAPGTGRAAADEHQGPVTVELASGRSLTAEVDPRTDETQLWLRWSHDTITILRPIRWERVVQAQVGGETLSKEGFRRVVVRPGEPAPSILREHSGRWPDAHATEAAGSAPQSAAVPTKGPGRRDMIPVESLAIDAWVANWDGDVEVDGLVVEVRPLDAEGAVVPVHGTLEVSLMGWESGRTGSQQPAVRLGRWTRLIRPDELGPSGATFRFPFQSVHPEFNLEWAPRGAVHARLSAAGRGVFETTESTVRIRPYSAARDYLQDATGQRFFRLEQTGRGRR